MYFLRKTFELAVCLLGYWLGRGFGGWGGGILLAFAGLCAWFIRLGMDGRICLRAMNSLSATKHFAFGAISAFW